MGQRLIVEFQYQGKTIAGLYQHWSAYTSDAFNTLESLLDIGNWHKPQNEKQALLQALEMMSNIDGISWDGYNPTDKDSNDEENGWVYIKKNFTGNDVESIGIRKISESFCKVGDRSTGLAIVGKPAEDCLDLGEYSIAIKLDEQNIEFDVYNRYENMVDYVDCCGNSARKPSRLILPKGVYIDFFKYSDMDYIASFLESMCNGYVYFAPSVGYDEDVIFGAIG